MLSLAYRRRYRAPRYNRESRVGQIVPDWGEPEEPANVLSARRNLLQCLMNGATGSGMCPESPR